MGPVITGSFEKRAPGPGYKTPNDHTQNRKLVLFWTFSASWNIPIVDIILDLHLNLP